MTDTIILTKNLEVIINMTENKGINIMKREIGPVNNNKKMEQKRNGKEKELVDMEIMLWLHFFSLLSPLVLDLSVIRK